MERILTCCSSQGIGAGQQGDGMPEPAATSQGRNVGADGCLIYRGASIRFQLFECAYHVVQSPQLRVRLHHTLNAHAYSLKSQDSTDACMPELLVT